MKWIELQHDEDNPSRIAHYTENDCGCYFDGAFGFEHNAKRLLEFAAKHGFTYTASHIADLDSLVWLVDAAEEWLNENTLRPPFIEGRREYFIHWGWYDGDFGLWKYDEDGEQI